MGKNRSSSTQTTSTTLPANQQRNVDVLLQGALDFFNSGGRSFYPGDIVADFDPLQTTGQNSIVNFAGGLGTDLVGDAIRSNSMLLDPSMLDPFSAPGFGGVIDGLINRSNQNLFEQVLPQVSAQGIASGQFGGTPTNVGRALAIDRADQATRDQTSQLALGQYGLGLDAMLQAIRNSPALFDLGLAPGRAIAGVGDIRQAQAQNEIQGNVARHEFSQNEPIFALQLLRDLTGQAGTYGGTTRSTNTQETSGSPFNQVLGGALAAASLVNPVASIFSGLRSTGIGGINPISSFGGNPISPFAPVDPFQQQMQQLLRGVGGG